MTEIFSQLVFMIGGRLSDLMSSNFGFVLILIGQGLLMAVFLLLSAYFLIYADRKVWAAVQLRRGPNVVGAFGLLQSGADMLKLVFKEIVVPAGSDKFVFFLAPVVSFVMAILAWAVIPLNEGWQLSNINVAILYVFAISSLEVYGVIMGGWASNSKYPFLGSLRSAAQMISYEVSIGLVIIGVIISTGSMNFGAIVGAQDTDYGIFGWYWLPHFPMLFLFFISALAETNRPPFDLPEADFVNLSVYNMMGQKIKTLTSENMTPGYHSIIWNGTNDAGSRVATGMYFYSINTSQFQSIKKMLFLK